MRKKIFILMIIVLGSCGEKKTTRPYSEDFYRTITNSGIKLHNDSLIFPNESGIDLILIPTTLSLNQEYVFKGGNSVELKLKRTNYTDIEFELFNNKSLEKGIASLRPTFYLGAESLETSEGAFWVTPYDAINSKYIETIDIGDESLTDEKPIEVFAFVLTKQESGIDSLIEINDLWKQRK